MAASKSYWLAEAGSTLVTPTSPTTLRVPAVVRAYNHPVHYLLAWTPYILAYEIVNHWVVIDPIELTMSALDQAIPFLPELIPIYVLYIPLFWWTASRSENDLVANRFFYATHLQLLLSLPWYVLYPVAMPRELFYPPAVYGVADAAWRWFDAPNNCFPSLHVANGLMFMVFNKERRYAPLVQSLTLAIIATTVLVKQHYVVDVLGGVAVFVVARWLLARIRIGGRGD